MKDGELVEQLDDINSLRRTLHPWCVQIMKYPVAWFSPVLRYISRGSEHPVSFPCCETKFYTHAVYS